MLLHYLPPERQNPLHSERGDDRNITFHHQLPGQKNLLKLRLPMPKTPLPDQTHFYYVSICYSSFIPQGQIGERMAFSTVADIFISCEPMIVPKNGMVTGTL